MILKKVVKKFLPDKIYRSLSCFKSSIYTNLQVASIKSAVREQRLLGLYYRLTEIVPDLTYQYTNFYLNNTYLITKVRALHSFQIDLVKKAIKLVDNNGLYGEGLRIIDIGDSCGTHLEYIKNMWPNKQMRMASINLDPEAIARIKQKGIEAICCRAEDIKAYSNRADIFLSFEMLEHLLNPFQFLHSLSKNSECIAFVITVPYVSSSRIGIHQIRNNHKMGLNAENTHILELSPGDWRLLFQFCGWRVKYDDVFLQYPKGNILRFMKYYWRKFDFEGFYGTILTRDLTWSDLYENWE